MYIHTVDECNFAIHHLVGAGRDTGDSSEPTGTECNCFKVVWGKRLDFKRFTSWFGVGE